ncbi:hypothetical protein MRX96_000632 [Rhipicephalus microplus]
MFFFISRGKGGGLRACRSEALAQSGSSGTAACMHGGAATTLSSSSPTSPPRHERGGGGDSRRPALNRANQAGRPGGRSDGSAQLCLRVFDSGQPRGSLGGILITSHAPPTPSKPSPCDDPRNAAHRAWLAKQPLNNSGAHRNKEEISAHKSKEWPMWRWKPPDINNSSGPWELRLAPYGMRGPVRKCRRML